jgi:hypothetical protein
MPQDDDHAAALEAMASGEHTPPAQQAEPLDDETPYEDDPAAALSDVGTQNTDVPPTPPTGQKRARQQKIRRAQAQATGMQMKKTMIPLLMVSGVILVLLGGLTAFMSGNGEVGETGMFDSGTIALLTIAAFVLGPILIIGGWLLHVDVKKSGN